MFLEGVNNSVLNVYFHVLNVCFHVQHSLSAHSPAEQFQEENHEKATHVPGENSNYFTGSFLIADLCTHIRAQKKGMALLSQLELTLPILFHNLPAL